ncbi:hypothetical protein ACJMK2_010504 [Sinanodonta woodiana]|uniref:Uncharacterized protein n=1 Tax=Sinanodonta woodiana TaxID=1069815 RepID=A0ABD3VIK4_SINWO
MFSKDCRIYLLLVNVVGSVYCDLNSDFNLLKRTLPGIYSNRNQYFQVSRNDLPSVQGNVAFRAIYRPVDVTFLHGAFNVYVEHHMKDGKEPFKQWLYSFNVDKRAMAIRMIIFNFLKPGLEEKIRTSSKFFKYLKPSDVSSQNGCTMIWRRLNTTFLGLTSKECIADFADEKIRISVMATLTSNSLQLNEVWHYLKDGNKKVELTVPIHLVKIHRIGPKEVKHTQSDEAESTTSHTELKSEKTPRSKRKSQTPIHSVWHLSNYKSITDTLNSGRDVNIFADLSGCKTIQGNLPSRHSFGDLIDVYVIGSHQGRYHDYLRFSRRKLITSDTGLEEVTREVTVHKNGSVTVTVIHSDPDTSHIRTVFIASCTLYNPDSSHGDIKFHMNPFKGMKPIHTFGALRSSLKKGKAVRMSINLAACNGASSTDVTIGGDFKNYDVLHHGKTLEMTLSRPSFISTVQEGLSLQTDNFMVTFTADERVMLTTYASILGGKFRDHSIVSGYRRYRCMMGNNANMKAVHFYKEAPGR